MEKPQKTANKKLCSTCGEMLPFSAFNRDRKAKDGLTHNCRECRKTAARNYRAKIKPPKVVNNVQ